MLSFVYYNVAFVYEIYAKKINLFGFDGTYNKSSKYFYKDSQNNDYDWNKKEEDKWEILFKNEMNSFKKFCNENHIEVIT